MQIRRLILIAAAAATLGWAGWATGSAGLALEAGPERSAQVLRAVPEGTVVRLLPGVHGPFEVATAGVTVQGVAGVTVRGPVRVGADGVRLRDLVVDGGEPGISIREADGVVIERVVVRGARLHGIEIAPGSATIRDCVIEGLVSPYAQGLELRNSSGRPRTVVEGCSVSSGQEGLVSHVSRVEFLRNTVTATSLRAIVITEMSEGVAEGNAVQDVSGVGLYCGDESHCEFLRNVVRGVGPAPREGRSHLGYGAIARYHATMRLEGNHVQDAAAGESGLFLHSRQVEASPLQIWPPGWIGAVPALWVAALSLLGLGTVWGGAHVVARRIRRHRGGPAGELGATGRNVLLAGFAVQSFHMLEHAVQVFQVYVAEAEVRSGLAGAAVDTEWVHFAYNAAVLGFLAWAFAVLRRALPTGAFSLLAAAVGVQAYHLAEHTAKVVQHVALGVNPAPGLVGDDVGLVWFHFGINLAVYAGFAGALLAFVRRSPPGRRHPEEVAGNVLAA